MPIQGKGANCSAGVSTWYTGLLLYSVQKKKKLKLKRSDLKSLQQEDSDAVWNELAYYRRENKNLMIDK